jgi:hypothetical protein
MKRRDFLRAKVPGLRNRINPATKRPHRDNNKVYQQQRWMAGPGGVASRSYREQEQARRDSAARSRAWSMADGLTPPDRKAPAREPRQRRGRSR